MASELSLLIPDFRKKLVEALTASRNRGFRVEPIATLVSPIEQAGLWKQGRSAIDAELKGLWFDNAKARYLATALRQGIVKATNVVTEDLPGFSWHQWGEAISVVWVDGQGKLNLSPNYLEHPQRLNGYKVFVEECEKMGLVAGPTFNSVQLRAGNVTDHYTVDQINAEMQKRYSR